MLGGKARVKIATKTTKQTTCTEQATNGIRQHDSGARRPILRASEATPDRGLGCAPYINFCQSKIDTNLLFSVSDRILREIWESRNFVILVPDLALADRAHIKNSKWQLQHTKHDNANLIFYSYSKRMWVLPVQVRVIKI